MPGGKMTRSQPVQDQVLRLKVCKQGSLQGALLIWGRRCQDPLKFGQRSGIGLDKSNTCAQSGKIGQVKWLVSALKLGH